MTESLKSCPFCGGTANIAKGIIEFWAYCPHCGAKAMWILLFTFTT